MKKSIKKKNGADHKKFVVRLVEEPQKFWTDSGYGFTTDLGSASRYTEDQGIRKLGEILHENKSAVCELVDLGVPYVSPVKVGTVVLNNNRGFAELIAGVPQIKGGVLLLVSHTGNRESGIQEFLESVYEEDLEILWDPELSIVPEDNEYYLEAHGFLHDDGVSE